MSKVLTKRFKVKLSVKKTYSNSHVHSWCLFIQTPCNFNANNELDNFSNSILTYIKFEEFEV